MAKAYPKNFGELSYNHFNKEAFLRTTQSFMRRVANRLAELGLVGDFRVERNPAGIAVGGDVYTYLTSPDERYGVLVTITHSCVLGNRPDGVVCYGQQRAPEAPPRKIKGKLYMGRIVGGNFFLKSADIEEDAVVDMCIHMLKTHPLAQKQQEEQAAA